MKTTQFKPPFAHLCAAAGLLVAVVGSSSTAGCRGAIATGEDDDAGDVGHYPWDAGEPDTSDLPDANEDWDGWQAEVPVDASLGCESTCVGTCFLSVCIATVASNVGHPSSIAVDDSYVYWTDSVNGTVMRALQAGGAPSTVASGQQSPYSVAVAGGSVYWIGQFPGGISLVTAPSGGGTPVTLVTRNGATLASLALNATNLYWSETDPGSPTGGALFLRANLDGSSVMTIATDTAAPAEIALGSDTLYWTFPGTWTCEPPGAQACTPQYHGDGALKSIPLDGGSVSVVAGHQMQPQNLAIAGGSVAFVTIGPDQGALAVGGNVVSVPIDGGEGAMIVPNADGPVDIKGTASGDVYWSGTYGISRIPVSGGAVARMAYVDQGAGLIAVGNTKVFWTEPCAQAASSCVSGTSGNIYSAPK